MAVSGVFGSIFPCKLPKIELEALRNGALAPDACFLNARDQLYGLRRRRRILLLLLLWPMVRREA
eukprot:643849-Prymnesium_polylepis.1